MNDKRSAADGQSSVVVWRPALAIKEEKEKKSRNVEKWRFGDSHFLIAKNSLVVWREHVRAPLHVPDGHHGRSFRGSNDRDICEAWNVSWTLLTFNFCVLTWAIHSAAIDAPPCWLACTGNRWRSDTLLTVRRCFPRLVACRLSELGGRWRLLGRSTNVLCSLDSSGRLDNRRCHRHNNPLFWCCTRTVISPTKAQAGRVPPPRVPPRAALFVSSLIVSWAAVVAAAEVGGGTAFVVGRPVVDKLGRECSLPLLRYTRRNCCRMWRRLVVEQVDGLAIADEVSPGRHPNPFQSFSSPKLEFGRLSPVLTAWLERMQAAWLRAGGKVRFPSDNCKLERNQMKLMNFSPTSPPQISNISLRRRLSLSTNCSAS